MDGLVDSLIESTPGVLYLYDEGGRFLRWNREFERVSGYGADEIRGMQPLDFFDGDDRARVAERIGDVFATGEARVEAHFVSKDRTRTPYLFTGRLLQLDGQRCLVGVGIDISERVRAEAAVRANLVRFRSTLDGMLEGCQLLDFDWRYLYVNDAAASHNRRPSTELVGRTMPEAWPGIEGTPTFALLRRCMEGRVAVHEVTEFAFADGAIGWFDVHAQPVPEGMFVLSVDITDRKRAEQALHELNRELERKVEERTADLAIAKRRAEAADNLKTAFLATMSHELRTPLNAILGFSAILLQGLPGPLNPVQTKQLGMVQTSARHLLDLINDVLDISKIEAGQLEVAREPFDLPSSITEVFELVRPMAEKKSLALSLEVAPALGVMVADRRRVQQILLNLLSNATKFTDAGRVSLIVTQVDEGGAPAARFVVRDTGVGIDRKELDELFRPFRQLDSARARASEGTGLGLAICRRLVDLLGGTIVVESEPGRGSAFEVTLPLAPRNE